MNSFVATTLVTVLEPKTGTDVYGDDLDEYSNVAMHVRAHVTESAVRAYDPSSGRLTTVHEFKALLPPGTRVVKGSRLRDESTDDYYLVHHVNVPASFVGPSAVRCDLKLVE